MLDIEIAKHQLLEKSLSLVIAKDGEIIFETTKSGVTGFLSAVDKLGRENLYGASLADRIVGRAAALLCAYAGVKAVYAVVLSEGGKRVLEENSVRLEFGDIVPSILNRQKTGACPFEKIVSDVSDGAEAYERLKSCALK
jgi:uncharacterized linocin/CFP29 family protein